MGKVIIGIVIGFLINAAMIDHTFDHSEKDGWIGNGKRVYKFEFVCLKDDADCLVKNNIDISERTNG